MAKATFPKTTAAFHQAQRLLSLGGLLDYEQLQALFSSRVLADVFEAVKSGKRINRKAVRKALDLEPLSLEFKTWRSIKLGRRLTAKDLLSAIDAVGYVTQVARDIMTQPVFTQSLAEADPDTQYDLVILTTAQLTGKQSGATTSEIFIGAEELGLEKCPPWIGPKLLLDLGQEEQPEDKWLLIGMEPISDSDDCLAVFELGHDERGLLLYSRYSRPDIPWSGRGRWVFVVRRK